MTGQVYFLPAGGNAPPTAAELEDATPIECVMDTEPVTDQQWSPHEVDYAIPTHFETSRTFEIVGTNAREVGEVLRRLFAFLDQPVPPMPRDLFDGTAREYRTARRTYARQVRTHRKASR